MRHEDPRTADTQAWLAKARQDLRAAEVDLAAEPPLLEDALFHCQQAVEKSLKALLCWNDRAFRKTHSIEELGEVCISVDASLAKLIDDTAHMTEYAWAFRYPGDMEVERAEAEEALALATRAVGDITALLPEAARQ